ncbi:hypothetical protein [Paraburkholderia terricola]|uniref:Uncharacterized protein n=1 Tax=Paraburkholderia terricola TaxID=169427 RepID=A0ABU1M096_9BURK|nr:hypothetical protein [Paraburkholderia terricola]MDR6412439.1 hypothetical protein [Paraburkholderia terricola]MDR6481112.1 hypothetical protein [Paraburkholderia terricola]
MPKAVIQAHRVSLTLFNASFQLANAGNPRQTPELAMTELKQVQISVE